MSEAEKSTGCLNFENVSLLVRALHPSKLKSTSKQAMDFKMRVINKRTKKAKINKR